MNDSDFEYVVEGPAGWTSEVPADTVGLLVRLGVLFHVSTMVRGPIRRRVFRPVDEPYQVNAASNVAPEMLARMMP